MYKIKNVGRMGRRARKRKTNMSAQLARMTQLLIMSSSTWKTGATTELYQGITSRMAEAPVPGSRGSRSDEGS
jgi:hypothetical protein